VVNDITVVDDYGHHPAEIRATLEAARGCKFNRLLVLFQPHRYSRTQHLWTISAALQSSHILALLDIYAATKPHPRRTSEALASAITEAGHKNVHYFRSMQEGIEYLLKQARPGRQPSNIGAGNVSGRAMNHVLLGTEHPTPQHIVIRRSSLVWRSERRAAAWRFACQHDFTGIGGTTDLVRNPQARVPPRPR